MIRGVAQQILSFLLTGSENVHLPNSHDLHCLRLWNRLWWNSVIYTFHRPYRTVSGLWPYGNRQLKWVARITMFFVAITFIITQLRMVFESIYKDWMVNRSKSELGIVKKYARRGDFFCNLYVANGCFWYVIFTIVAVAPHVPDLISPKNGSRGVGFVYAAYYYLDEEEHYCIIMGHMLSVTAMFIVSIMDARTVEKRFLRINKFLGILTGVWPYQNARAKRAGQFITLSITFSSVLTQTAYHVFFPSVDGVVCGVPFYVAAVGTFVKMGNYCFDENKLRTMLNHIFEDWEGIKSKDEYDIMVIYSQKGALVTLGYFLHLALALSSLSIFPLISPILDIISPLNESRSRAFIYPAYYWIDEDKYYLLKTEHMIIVACVVCCTFCACDANYVYAVQHACGLLAITKHRFISMSTNLPSREEWSNMRLAEIMKYRNICHSIQAHQHALEYLKLIESSHHTYLFISMGMLISAVSVSLLQVANDDNDRSQWFMNTMFFFAELFHVFVLTVQGQFVINSLDEVYAAIYDSPWYETSSQTQALYVLVLRSCLNPPLLTAGGIITLNLQSFAEIIKASVSYYTVMKAK